MWHSMIIYLSLYTKRQKNLEAVINYLGAETCQNRLHVQQFILS